VPSPPLPLPPVALEPPQAPASNTATPNTRTELLALPTTVHPTWPQGPNKGAHGRAGW
jgi:hypothetical protein